MWTLYGQYFHVRLINENGQLAEGYSLSSYEEALANAHEDAKHVPPIIRRTHVPKAKPTIEDFLL